MTFQPHLLFINGACRDCSTGKRIPQINPASEETFAEVAAASLPDLETAIEGAHQSFTREWRDLTPRKRTDVLFKVAHAIRAHAEELAQLESRNIGKPISDARDEVELGARVFEYYAGGITRLFGQTIPVGPPARRDCSPDREEARRLCLVSSTPPGAAAAIRPCCATKHTARPRAAWPWNVSRLSLRSTCAPAA